LGNYSPVQVTPAQLFGKKLDKYLDMLTKLYEISCRRATFLASKKEAGKTSYFENLKLDLHYKICEGCKLFDNQTSNFSKNAKHTHNHIDVAMKAEKKQKIKDMIKKLKN